MYVLFNVLLLHLTRKKNIPAKLVGLMQWLRLLALIPADGVQFPIKAAVFS